MSKKLSLMLACILVFAAANVLAQDYCEGNFDCDLDVDGTDAFTFKTDFGRSSISNPCPASGDCCSGSLSPLGRWCEQFNGTVKDMTTGLVWLKDAGWGDIKKWADCITWDDAHAKAGILYDGLQPSDAGLSDGSVEGDWRLPTKSELVGITVGDEYIRSSQMYFFTNVQPYIYWSSTTYAFNPIGAWYVYMVNGGVDADFKYNDGYVWPVRGGAMIGYLVI